MPEMARTIQRLLYQLQHVLTLNIHPHTYTHTVITSCKAEVNKQVYLWWLRPHQTTNRLNGQRLIGIFVVVDCTIWQPSTVVNHKTKSSCKLLGQLCNWRASGMC